METKNKIFIKVILFLLGFSNLLAQESAIEILQKVKDNSTLIENAKYKFIITSEFENNLLPINGVFYIKGAREHSVSQAFRSPLKPTLL